MRRTHRKAHRILWLVLGPLAVLGLILGVANRAPVPTQDSPLKAEAPDTDPPSREAEEK